MENKTYRKCKNCGLLNLNNDYCSNCGELINILLKRKLERAKQDELKKSKTPSKRSSKIAILFEKSINSKNLFVRSVARLLKSIWVIFLAVGSFLALLFGYIAA